MKTEEQILKRIKECENKLDDVECQDDINQVKIYAYLDILRWTLKD